MNRAVFLDRDGVINRKAPEGEYISSRNQFVLLPNVVEAVRELCVAGFLIVIVTNQRGVARLKIELEELDHMHRYLLDLFSAAGAPITAIYVCPHEGGCECRKPAPGMLLRAAKEHGIELQASWMVGDSASDAEAGKRAGCRTAWIWNGPDSEFDEQADLRAHDLSELARQILRFEGIGALVEPARQKVSIYAEAAKHTPSG